MKILPLDEACDWLKDGQKLASYHALCQRFGIFSHFVQAISKHCLLACVIDNKLPPLIFSRIVSLPRILGHFVVGLIIWDGSIASVRSWCYDRDFWDKVVVAYDLWVETNEVFTEWRKTKPSRDELEEDPVDSEDDEDDAAFFLLPGDQGYEGDRPWQAAGRAGGEQVEESGCRSEEESITHREMQEIMDGAAQEDSSGDEGVPVRQGLRKPQRRGVHVRKKRRRIKEEDDVRSSLSD